MLTKLCPNQIILTDYLTVSQWMYYCSLFIWLWLTFMCTLKKCNLSKIQQLDLVQKHCLKPKSFKRFYPNKLLDIKKTNCIFYLTSQTHINYWIYSCSILLSRLLRTNEILYLYNDVSCFASWALYKFAIHHSYLRLIKIVYFMQQLAFVPRFRTAGMLKIRTVPNSCSSHLLNVDMFVRMNNVSFIRTQDGF